MANIFAIVCMMKNMDSILQKLKVGVRYASTWFAVLCSMNLSSNGSIIKEKAIRVALGLGFANFRASNT
jgi:hypothetical protein